MKKSLLSVGLLALAINANAQILTYVGDAGLVTVTTDCLVYSGGGIQVAGTGLIDNSGNVMMVGGPFLTTQADGTTAKTDGGNFILRLTDKTNYSTYGQFYLTGGSGQPIAQTDITGIVDKEYLDLPHGSYQQIGLPFSGKTFTSLSTDLGASFADNRWTQTEVLSWDNKNVKSDNIPLSATTANGATPVTGTSTAVYKGKTYGTSTFTNKNTAYYMLGSKNWKANAPASGTVFTVKGVPFADGITETLSGAGAGVTFGSGGTNLNIYKEQYKTYVNDPFVTSAWSGNYGKDTYQFGNPFLTNLDLKNIVGGPSSGDDDNNITNLIGIRYSVDKSIWDSTLGTGSTNSTYKFVTFADNTPIGDPIPVIKPMGYFVLKLKDTTSQTLKFDKLRRFKYTTRNSGTIYDVTAARVNSTSSVGRVAAANTVAAVSKPSTTAGAGVKQIGLIALNAEGQEMGRTYYAVYPTAITGVSDAQTAQVRASNADIIGTFEEAKTGGIDSSVAQTYWLYINVANDTDFRNKEVPVKITSANVSKIRVELKENGEQVASNVSGDSFYIKDGASAKAVKDGDVIALSSNDFFVSYGMPDSGTLATTSNVAKPSESVVVFDEAISKHIIIFDRTWKAADVAVYDMSGKLIHSASKVNTANNYEISLPEIHGAYVVTAVSDSGQKFVQKIKK